MGFISGIIITTIFFPRKMDTYKQKEPNRFSKTINKKKKNHQRNNSKSSDI